MPHKDPTSYSIITYFWVTLLSAWGGVVSFLTKVKTGAARPFSVEVVEDEKAYAVHAELPGVTRDDIHVTIDGNDVAISAEVKNQREDRSEGRVLRSERYYGKLYRAFQLADAIDEGAAEAKYADGVLELRLPKKAVTSAKRLEIR